MQHCLESNHEPAERLLRTFQRADSDVRPIQAFAILVLLSLFAGCSPADTNHGEPKHLEHPYLFHLIQADLWEAAVSSNSVYFPPTYEQDGFTHATANPKLLLNVANHFYQEVPGKWMCLRMTVDSLSTAGTEVVFEGTAPVGDKPANFEGTGDELFPHVLGGIHPSAVLEVHDVRRSDTGEFLEVSGVTAN